MTNSSAVLRAQDDHDISLLEFLKAFFAHTTGPIYFASFANDRHDAEEPGERHIITRNVHEVLAFKARWDKPGRGMFFSTGVLQENASKRCKETILQTVCLHADIDIKHVDLLGDAPLSDVLRNLSRLRMLPSIVISSGGGIHAYWLLTEPMNTATNVHRIEAVLRLLADAVAGDLAVCEVARVMRVPGSYNSKYETPKLVEIIEFHPRRRYEFEDIEDWMTEQSPVMLRRRRELARTAGQNMPELVGPEDGGSDFYAQYAASMGFKPSVNVERRLRDMMYMAGGENSVHLTQLSVTASLLNAQVPIDDVVERVMTATRAASGEYGVRWNWRREERKVRRMCETWMQKRVRRNRKRRSWQ